MRISDWSSDVCSSDLLAEAFTGGQRRLHRGIGLDVAADALGNREHRGVVGRVGNTETGLNPLGGFVEVGVGGPEGRQRDERSEEHTSELQSLMRISYAVFCLNKQKHKKDMQINKHKT